MLAELFKAYQESLETALSIDVILGYPDTSRNSVTLPVAALTFLDDDYARVTPAALNVRRIGQPNPAGASCRAMLWLYAANERNLLALIDTLRTVKADLTGLTVDDTNVTVTYQPTVRQPFDVDETQLRYTVATELLFKWGV